MSSDLQKPWRKERGYSCGSMVFFNRPLSQIVFGTSDLDRELIVDRTDATSVLERHAQDLLSSQLSVLADAGRPLSERVTKFVRERIGSDQTSVLSVASHFGMSPRSLQRDLASERTSVRRIVRTERQLLAETRLSDDNASNASIARAIGYADPTASWRAFKQWSGDSPSSFRSKHKKPAQI